MNIIKRLIDILFYGGDIAVEVKEVDNIEEDVLGICIDGGNSVLIKKGLGELERMGVLIHELGHSVVYKVLGYAGLEANEEVLADMMVFKVLDLDKLGLSDDDCVAIRKHYEEHMEYFVSSMNKKTLANVLNNKVRVNIAVEKLVKLVKSKS